MRIVTDSVLEFTCADTLSYTDVVGALPYFSYSVTSPEPPPVRKDKVMGVGVTLAGTVKVNCCAMPGVPCVVTVTLLDKVVTVGGGVAPDGGVPSPQV